MKTPHAMLSALAIALCACGGSTQTVRHDARDEETGRQRQASDQRPTVAERDARVADCDAPSVFFDYDSADLSPRSRDALQRAASCLREHPDKRVQLVGATDPRGTEEYNLALGDRRARTVRSYLTALGIDGGRLAVTSVGEEEARGTDESGWAEDRKVAPR